MKRLSTLGLSLAVIAILGLSGCSGSSSDDTTTNETEIETTTVTISGKVADGYLDNAKVCLDKNVNGQCDSDEPNTLSVNGNYDLNITAIDVSKYPILVEVTTQTKDLDDGNFIQNPYILSAPKDSTEFISPITTLIQNEIEKSPALTKEEATSKVSTRLGITSTNSKLLIDYVETNSDNELLQLHEVAKVVANMQGALEQKIVDDGIVITDSNKKAIKNLILNSIYDDINNTSSLVINGTSANEIDITTKIANIGITNDDILLTLKTIDLTATSTTIEMENLLSIPFYTFKHGRVDGVKFVDGKFYVGSSEISSGATGVSNISTNMQNVETYSILADGSIQLSNGGQTTFKRVSRLDANGKTFKLKDILTILTEDNIPIYQKLEDHGIVITQAQYDIEVTFSSGDYLYLLIQEQHNNGTFIDVTYNLNNTAMQKVVEVLK